MIYQQFLYLPQQVELGPSSQLNLSFALLIRGILGQFIESWNHFYPKE
jgi:hypothetical protein